MSDFYSDYLVIQVVTRWSFLGRRNSMAKLALFYAAVE